MMQRHQCLAVLARHITDEIVVATYSSAFEWLELGERSLNYFSVGAMGLDSSHALGLALGRPDRRVICLQGDGSLLMNLGALVTIAAGVLRLIALETVPQDLYYDAAVRSMTLSLHNFFFVSYDPGGLITVDKPPLGLWLQTVSAAIFGFHPLSLLVPEALCAVAAACISVIQGPPPVVSSQRLSGLNATRH